MPKHDRGFPLSGAFADGRRGATLTENAVFDGPSRRPQAVIGPSGPLFPPSGFKAEEIGYPEWDEITIQNVVMAAEALADNYFERNGARDDDELDFQLRSLYDLLHAD